MPETREGLGAGGATGDRKPWEQQPDRWHFTAVKILFKISLYVSLLKYYQNQFLNSIRKILASCKEKEKQPQVLEGRGTHVLFGGSWKTSLCRAWLQENLRPRRLWFHSVLGASSAMDFAAFLLHPSVAQTVEVSREKVKIQSESTSSKLDSE